MGAWLLWCASVWGFSCLACSMSKHQRDIFSTKVSAQKTRLFQVVGWVILIMTALLAICWKGASIGFSEWLGIITFAPLVIGLTLTYYPKKLLQLNIVVTVLFVILLFVTILR